MWQSIKNLATAVMKPAADLVSKQMDLERQLVDAGVLKSK